MGLFKEFKEDLTQAVNDMIPEEEAAASEGKAKGSSGGVVKAAKPAQNARPARSLVSTEVTPAPQPEVGEEVSVILKGTKITGNMETDGSTQVLGTIHGDLRCKGKIYISGYIEGNTQADAIIIEGAKTIGEIDSVGEAFIGANSIVVGNVVATSAVIAGAVKGDIDINGPVSIESTAIILGNIKSRSVEVAAGAVIEGSCSQCYADTKDLASIFE